MTLRVSTLLLTAMLSTSTLALTPMNYEQTIEQWRSERVGRLQQPNGWLSLVGLHWLELKKAQTVGRAADNDVVLAVGPDRLGEIGYDGKQFHFTPNADAGVMIDFKRRAGAVPILADSALTPTMIVFDEGQGQVQLIERVGKFALRVRDARAKTRTGFVGIDYFPIDQSWQLEATFEPHPEGKTIEITNVIGQLEPMKNPGVVVFERDGKTYRLEAVDEGDGQLFLIFSDRTNGKDTYGAGRFLYAAAAVDGKTVVDFNKAYNPPCAFNAYSTCPLPPPENRLDLAITAGEKKYRGATH